MLRNTKPVSLFWLESLVDYSRNTRLYVPMPIIHLKHHGYTRRFPGREKRYYTPHLVPRPSN